VSADSGLSWTNNPDGGCALSSPYSSGDSSTAVGPVSATIVDLAGAPAPAESAIVCGVDMCTAPASTSASGAVTVGSDVLQLAKPMFRYGDALGWARFLVPVTEATTSLGTLVTAPLPATGAPLVPGGSAASGEVIVTVPAGGSVSIDTVAYDTPDKQAFRAVAIPAWKESAMPGLASNELLVLYGVAPAGAVFCPPATVSVPNTLGWPGGIPVEFFILGDDPSETWAPYGDWAKISNGVVSPDGSFMVTSEGFPVLGVFAVRPKC
jgi:hypothetical protein